MTRSASRKANGVALEIRGAQSRTIRSARGAEKCRAHAELLGTALLGLAGRYVVSRIVRNWFVLHVFELEGIRYQVDRDRFAVTLLNVASAAQDVVADGVLPFQAVLNVGGDITGTLLRVDPLGVAGEDLRSVGLGV